MTRLDQKCNIPTVAQPGINSRVGSGLRLCLHLITVLIITPAVLIFSSFPAAADNKERKKVLVITTGARELPGNVIVDRSIQATLSSGSPDRIEYYSESMDLDRFPGDPYRQHLLDLYRQKYANRKFDLIMAVAVSGLSDLLKDIKEFFPGTPIVFATLDRNAVEGENLGPDVTGVLGKFAFKKGLGIALSLQPNTRRVVVVGGAAASDQVFIAEARQEFREYQDKVEISYLAGLPMKDLQTAVSRLPEHTIIYFVSMLQDGAGNSYDNPEALRLFAPVANAAIYGAADTLLGHGITGGHLLSFNAIGVKAAEMGLPILRGENPAAIPILDTGTNLDMFDWRQLRRWGISEKRLPPGSVVRFKRLSVWEEYEWYIAGAIALCIIQSLLIYVLLRLQKRLRKARQSAEERHHFEALLAELSAAFVYLPIGEVDQAIEQWLARLREFLGVDQILISEFSPDQTRYYITHSTAAPGVDPFPKSIDRNLFPWYTQQILSEINVILSRIPDDLPAEASAERQYCLGIGLKSSVSIPLSIRGSSIGVLVLCSFRSYRVWLQEFVSRLQLVGESFANAITRKRAETEVTENRARLAGIIESAMDGIITIDENQHVILFNSAAEAMFGCSEAEALGQPIERFLPRWLRDAHSEHNRALGETKVTQRAIGKLGGTRGLHADGHEFPIEASISQVEAGGQKLYTVILRDITLREQAETALRISEDRYRDIVENSLDLICIHDLRGRILSANPAMIEALGYAPDYSIGKKGMRDIMAPEFRDQFDEYLATIKLNGSATGLMVVETSTGERRIWEYNNTLRTEGVAIPIVRGIARDVTERKRAEEALHAALDEVSELKNQLQAENIYLQEEIRLTHNFDEIIGNSDALKYVLYKVEQVAAAETTVLVLGETGTGKELIARAIHQASPRKDRPLVKVNCAALPANLIESELFGHEKGAFTGAQARKVGRFELANGGTLFLDEIGELPLELQPKLLRILQDGEFERVGGSKTLKVDVRVIAATNRNLQLEVPKGLFREDLWYRLNVFPITLPPLRNRKDDIPTLVNFFINQFSRKLGRGIKSVEPAIMKTLQNYRWPGNVRELSNVIERAVINTQGSVLQLADNLETPQETGVHFIDSKSFEELEREIIIQRLEQTNWKISGPGGAANSLGLNPSTLRTRMIKLGIQRSEDHS
jgi:formate hydrogenlyase transcriptional activator